MAMLGEVARPAGTGAGGDAGRSENSGQYLIRQGRELGCGRLPTEDRRLSSSDRLRDLARRVERLGVGGRTDPEQIVLGKLGIAGELRALARELAA
jgi:hypothetical protein